MKNNIAFIAYETPFAPCGGVAAVMGRLPATAQTVAGQEVAVFTPFHFKVGKTAEQADKLEIVGRLTVPLDGAQVPVEIGRLQDERCTWYFVKSGRLEGVADEEQLFAGDPHPYTVPLPQMVRDALFFGMAVAKALETVDAEAGWSLMLQDWQASTVALGLASLSPERPGNRAFLTLHNSYDSGGLAGEDLLRVGMAPWKCHGPSAQATVLERALRLVQEPVTTVSDQFAKDFLEEPLQYEVMAPQLREALRPRLFGVDNGLFVDRGVEQALARRAATGDFAPLKKWKAGQRQEFLQAIDGLKGTHEKPVWGDPSRFSKAGEKEAMPWFILLGRDDPRQKGYDVAEYAIRRHLEGQGRGRFLFLPILGDEGLAGLTFLADLSYDFPEQVLTLPFRFEAGFLPAMRGAAYGVMASLYEPFGMANEFYLNGTAAVGRATGGIMQQIVPLRACAAFSRAVQARATRWHSASTHPTGILYRERDGIASLFDDWRGINEGQYDRTGGHPNRVEARQGYPLFDAMAAELQRALADGARVYEEEEELYYRMVAEGLFFVQRTFSWERAATEYIRLALS